MTETPTPRRRQSTAARLLGKLERTLGELTPEEARRVCTRLADPLPDPVAVAYERCRRAFDHATDRDQKTALAWLEAYVDDLDDGTYDQDKTVAQNEMEF